MTDISIPVLRFTRRAGEKILDTLGSVQDDSSLSGLTPVLGWVNKSSSDAEFMPGLYLALQERNKTSLLEDGPKYLIGDTVVLLDLDEQRVEDCKKKILDFRNGRFVLLYPDDLESL